MNRKRIEYRITETNLDSYNVDWREAKRLIAKPLSTISLIERVTRYGNDIEGDITESNCEVLFTRA